MPEYFRVGKHRAFIIDFPMELFAGSRFILIVKVEMCRLTLTQLKLVENYIQKAEFLF